MWPWKHKTIMMWKRVGETPLAALERLRRERPALAHEKLTYAGRLDPMAEGKLLVLIGEECKRREKYLGLDKTYEVDVLFGVGSDTGDVLGIVRKEELAHIEKATVRTALAKLVGDSDSPYPVFSSKTVHGKPLFLWALEGRLGEIEIPVQHSRLYRARVRRVRTMQRDELEAYVRSKIALLPPSREVSKELGRDFRRRDVLASWQDAFTDGTERYSVASITVRCSSGTYMRSLVGLLGTQLGTHALALAITRTRIG